MSNQETKTKQLLVGGVIVALLALSAWSYVWPWFGGSGIDDVNTVYGRRRSRATSSVNGTAVFAEMFRQTGSKISSWVQLSPRLQRSDTIVWVPNSFELPSAKEIAFFEEQWLGTAEDEITPRTLIYVARDFDAAIEYWRTQKEASTGKTFLKSESRLARAQADHAYARSLTAREMQSEWFSIDSSQAFVDVVPVEGEWVDELNLQTSRISVAGELEWSDDDADVRNYEVLLGSIETPLIVRITDEYEWPNAQVIVCLNGSSVLNLPLVNHENRKIAAKLIDVCEAPKRVTFLESGASGVPISTSDPNAYSGFDALTQWPVNSPFMHLVVAGILFCAMVFPIFGRPRELTDDTISSFGKHIHAIGELLALTGDRDTAMARIKQYRNLKIEPIAAELPTSRQESGNPFKVSEV